MTHPAKELIPTLSERLVERLRFVALESIDHDGPYKVRISRIGAEKLVGEIQKELATALKAKGAGQ